MASREGLGDKGEWGRGVSLYNPFEFLNMNVLRIQK